MAKKPRPEPETFDVALFFEGIRTRAIAKGGGRTYKASGITGAGALSRILTRLRAAGWTGKPWREAETGLHGTVPEGEVRED